MEERVISKTDSIVDGVIDQLVERSQRGKLKYGVTLDRGDLSMTDWIQHAIEEHLDAVLYLTKIKKVLENGNSETTTGY